VPSNLLILNPSSSLEVAKLEEGKKLRAQVKK
jgi:hypothetical protein